MYENHEGTKMSLTKKSNNCNAFYVGKTGRITKQMMIEHRKAVEKEDEKNHIYKH